MDKKILEFYARRQMRLDSRGINLDVGTAASGNWGHVGRPGKRGGSQSGGGSGFRMTTHGESAAYEIREGKKPVPGAKVKIGNTSYTFPVYASRAKMRKVAADILKQAEARHYEIMNSGTSSDRARAESARDLYLARRLEASVNKDVKTADPKKKGKKGYDYKEPSQLAPRAYDIEYGPNEAPEVAHKEKHFASERRSNKASQSLHRGGKNQNGFMDANSSVFESVFGRPSKDAELQHGVEVKALSSDLIDSLKENFSASGKHSGKRMYVSYPVKYEDGKPVQFESRIYSPEKGGFIRCRTNDGTSTGNGGVMSVEDLQKKVGNKQVYVHSLNGYGVGAHESVSKARYAATPAGKAKFAREVVAGGKQTGWNDSVKWNLQDNPKSRYVTSDGVYGVTKKGEMFKQSVSINKSGSLQYGPKQKIDRTEFNGKGIRGKILTPQQLHDKLKKGKKP